MCWFIISLRGKCLVEWLQFSIDCCSFGWCGVWFFVGLVVFELICMILVVF